MSSRNTCCPVGNKEEEEDDEEERLLSNHTISMRAALKHCKTLWDSLNDTTTTTVAAASSSPTSPSSPPPPLQQLIVPLHLQHKKNAAAALDAWKSAQSVPTQRCRALKDVAEALSIPIVSYDSQDDIMSSSSVGEFQKRFLHANRPCVIRGGRSLLSNYFPISTDWCTMESTVNRDWFCTHVGEDTIVPVRRQRQAPTNSTTTYNDDDDFDGRAQECETVHMTLRQWCDTCDDNDDRDNKSSHLYLKDWHFQKWWEEQQERTNATTTPDDDDDEQQQQLYKVPPFFQHDLLNSFLRKFTNGDYRFVYWGPTGSTTSRHSDVLHSFSWSYNVVGRKKWTFYVTRSTNNNNNGNQQQQRQDDEIIFIQNAGELVLVPSTWVHRVENLCETLSINHNWITTANIDLTWDCLISEMHHVDVELAKWNDMDDDDDDEHHHQPSSSWDAKEFMLRGCTGLDVTAFFFMVMTELLGLLAKDVTCLNGDEDTWGCYFDIWRLHDILEPRLLREETHLQERLASVLEDQELATRAMDIATTTAWQLTKAPTMLEKS